MCRGGSLSPLPTSPEAAPGPAAVWPPGPLGPAAAAACARPAGVGLAPWEGARVGRAPGMRAPAASRGTPRCRPPSRVSLPGCGRAARLSPCSAPSSGRSGERRGVEKEGASERFPPALALGRRPRAVAAAASCASGARSFPRSVGRHRRDGPPPSPAPPPPPPPPRPPARRPAAVLVPFLLRRSRRGGSSRSPPARALGCPPPPSPPSRPRRVGSGERGGCRWPPLAAVPASPRIPPGPGAVPRRRRRCRASSSLSPRRLWTARSGGRRAGPACLSFSREGASRVGSLAPLASPPHLSDSRPQIRRGDPLNLSILVSGGKETNQDSLSNGE